MKKFYIISILFVVNFMFSQEEWSSNKVVEFQDKLNKSYKDTSKSPLLEEDLAHFEGLDFYPINPKFAVKASFVRTKKEKIFKMKTSTNRLPKYKKYGEYHFSIAGKAYKLNVYQNVDLSKKKEYKDYLFLPYSDLTCGKESYIGGRYIDMKIPTTNEIILDFNQSYNPYCAYNHHYSCPIVPLENDLNIEILAGVKKFHD